METEYISKCGNYKLIIEPDDNCDSPDDWRNDDLFLVYDHRQFDVKREGFNPRKIYDYLMYPNKPDFTSLVDKAILLGVEDPEEYANNEIKEWENNRSDEYDDYWIFPVAAYIHSGVSLSLTNSFERQGFDTSVSGFILAQKTVEGKTFKINRTKEECKIGAEGLIETWNTYLSGDVYGFRLLKKEARYSINKETWESLAQNGDESKALEYFTEEIEWEEIDSCWGFYGSDIKENGILEHISSEIEFEI
jgi:hypothetical protein